MLLTAIFIFIGIGGWTIICIAIGFRAGRMTIDRPMEPVKIPFTKKRDERVIEEDPYHEPMHGTPQQRIATIPGE